MLIKICGIKTVEAAQVAVTSGANFIGFVFAPSKRYIPPEDAQVIAQTIPSTVKKVGVFVNDTVEQIQKIAELVGLDIIQLHGDEPAEVAKQLRDQAYQVIRAVSADRLEVLTSGPPYPCDYLLLDSPPKEYRGGSGEPFNWEVLDHYQIDRSNIILAGGLSSKNVCEAITSVQPAGVDVSTGVETNGEKDHEKIKAFIQNARITTSTRR